jgi:hypothetical protein
MDLKGLLLQALELGHQAGHSGRPPVSPLPSHVWLAGASAGDGTVTVVQFRNEPLLHGKGYRLSGYGIPCISGLAHMVQVQGMVVNQFKTNICLTDKVRVHCNS